MAISNRARVECTLDALRDALGPYVLRAYKAAYGAGYRDTLNRNIRSVAPRLSSDAWTTEEALLAALDVHKLLTLMWRAWPDAFQDSLGYMGRSYVSELLGARNDWAHQVSFDNDRTYRIVDTAARLLKDIGAREQARAVEEIASELLRLRLGGEAQHARETVARELAEAERAKEAAARELRNAGQRLLEAARELREAGLRLLDTATPGRPLPTVPEPAPPRRKVDDGTAELDERRGETVRSIAKAARTRSKRRLSAGLKTPQSTYRIPILRALTEAGGAARTARVLDRVYELMQHRLNDYDLQMKPSGREPRWRNTAQFERLRMVREGLLADDSPTGIWEITEAGRRYLAEQDDKQSPDD